MPTANQRDREKERFWQRMVRRWERGGLSVRAFCQEEGVSEPSFYDWRRRLARRDAEVQFIPVEVVPEPTAAELELVLDGGRRLRIGPGFDAATLQRLLAVLEEARP